MLCSFALIAMGAGNWEPNSLSSSRFGVCLSNTGIYPATAESRFPNAFEKATKFLASASSQQEMLLSLDSSMTQFRDYSSCQNNWWRSLLEVENQQKQDGKKELKNHL